MKRLMILGAGTAGTTTANQLRRRLGSDWTVTVIDPEATTANQLRRRLGSDWTVTVIDPEARHLYQPGLVFLPFGRAKASKLERPRKSTLRRDVEWINAPVELIEPDHKRVVVNGEPLPYDILIIATGSHIRPEETPGMLGDYWYQNVFDFYTLEGADRLRKALADFEGGKLAVNVVENPIKCPVAPLEFAFLADDYFTQRGIRSEVEITYVTPLDGAFTRPVASRTLGSMLERKGVKVETEFNTGEVDGEKGILRSYDEREVPYDLLITVPTHMGAAVIDKSGLGDELGFVPTDPHTLAAKDHDDVFVLGDATNLNTSKAGSVAHFESHLLVDNIVRLSKGQSLEPTFDGHANCFVESGFGKAMLIDFNYDVEPLPGTFPLPVVGPMSLLKETRLNHLGKLAFEWVYWHALLPGHPLPVSNRMSMTGKRQVEMTKKEQAAA